MKSNRVSEDEISNLPSTIIETILCLVPIRDAVKTSILSKKWRYNWPKIPKLVFSERDMFKDYINPSSLDEWIDTESQSENIKRIELTETTTGCKVSSALRQVMLTYRGPIVEFCFTMDLVKLSTCAELDEMIDIVSRQNTLKKLTIDFPFDHDCDDCFYRLPLSVFSMNLLTDLYLCGCDLDFVPTFGGCCSLTSLYLDNVDVSQKTLLHLISTSPLLKSVSLLLQCENVIGYTKDDDSIVKLFACLPTIERLTFTIAVIHYFFRGSIPRELPKTLMHLKFFYLSEMTFDNNGYEIPFIFLLIKSSPNLEKIKLQITGIDETDPVKMEDYSDIRLEHLTEVEITDFFNSKNELEFVKLILAKSPVLKKLNIFLDREVTYDDEMALITTLLRSPRQSLDVEISVEWEKSF